MTPTPADREKARKIVCENTFGWSECEGVDELTADQERHVDAIATALAEAREEGRKGLSAFDKLILSFAPLVIEACDCDSIIDCTGEKSVVRRVLGTLPVTADGAVAGIACTLWFEDANWMTMRRPQFYEKDVAHVVNLSRAYSTKDAAQQAAETERKEEE